MIKTLALLLLAGQAHAGWFQPGAYGTVGSAGYGRWAVTGDGGWKEKDLDPYVSSELGQDNFQRTFTLIGGASKKLDEGLTGRAGAGFTVGHIKETDGSASSFDLELGLDRDLGPGALLGQYRLTAGTVDSRSSAPGAVRSLTVTRPGAKGRTGTTFTPQSQDSNELSVGYWWPLDGFSLTFRETVGLASYRGPIYTESVTGKRTFGSAREWAASSTLSADAGASSGVYLSVGMSYLFE